MSLAKATGNDRFAYGLLPPVHPDVRRRRHGRAEGPRRGPTSRFEVVIEGLKHERPARRRGRGHQAQRRRPQGTGRPLQEAGQGQDRQGLPERPLAAAERGRERGLRQLDERPGDRLPPQVQHPRRVGHGRERAGDGVRQHRRGTAAAAWPSPATRPRDEKVFLRRVPDERPGRGRGGRRADAGAGGPAGQPPAQGVRRAGQGAENARGPLQGRAGLRVHDPGRQAVHAPDPQRQADRAGGRADRRRDGQGEADRLADGRDARPGRPAGPGAGPDLRPRGREGRER